MYQAIYPSTHLSSQVARKLPLLPVQGASLEVSEGLVLPPEQPEAGRMEVIPSGSFKLNYIEL